MFINNTTMWLKYIAFLCLVEEINISHVSEWSSNDRAEKCKILYINEEKKKSNTFTSLKL